MRLVAFLGCLLWASPVSAQQVPRGAVLVVDFPTSQPSHTETLTWMRGSAAQVDAYYTAQSYQRFILTTDVWGIYTVPLDINATRAQVKAAAQQAASDAGVDLSVYRYFCYISPATNFVRAGYGDSQGCWIAAHPDFPYVPGWQLLAHELGHHIGIYTHSSGQGCFGCATTSYGDFLDVMGSYFSIGQGHFSPIWKQLKGWFTTDQVQSVAYPASGDYLVAPYETFVGVKTLAVQVGARRQIGPTYYVTYQQPYAGVVLRNTGGANGSNLLWMTPSTTTPALSVGESHCWRADKTSISVLSVSSAGALVRVGFGPCR